MNNILTVVSEALRYMMYDVSALCVGLEFHGISLKLWVMEWGGGQRKVLPNNKGVGFQKLNEKKLKSP